MAYFPNGTSWDVWHSQNCEAGCVHYDEANACGIELLHFEYSYESAGESKKAKKLRSVLNLFIPETDDKLGAKRCNFFFRDPLAGQRDLFDPEKDR